MITVKTSATEEFIALEAIDVKLDYEPEYKVFKLQGKKWQETGTVSDAFGGALSEDQLTTSLNYVCGWGTDSFSALRERKSFLTDFMNHLTKGRRDIYFRDVTVEPDVANKSIDVYITFSKNLQVEQRGIIGWMNESAALATDGNDEEEYEEEYDVPLTTEDRVEWGRQVAMATEGISSRPRRSQVKPLKADEHYTGYNGIKTDYNNTTHRLRKTYGLDDDNE